MDKLLKNFKSGFVAVVGRPNSGKSTLINALVGSKVSIVSNVPQTTRHQIRAVMNTKQAQVVFVDTPGIHSFKDELSSKLNAIAPTAFSGCDLVLYVADSSRQPGNEEAQIMDTLLKQNSGKIIMVLNKIDLGGRFCDDYVAAWKTKVTAKGINDPIVYFLPLAATTKQNLDILKDAILENLTANPAFYPKDTLTDFPPKFRAADIIREKICQNLKEELPHSCAVEIETFEPGKAKSKNGKPTNRKNKAVLYIKANIYVLRDSQKKIVIGKNACILKLIGQTARQELEEVFKKKVFLELFVKVLADWQQNPRILKELGYIE